MKQIIILAGPNGAGKITFAAEFLPNEAAVVNFINADLIAFGLSPFDPESVAIEAARILLYRIDDVLAVVFLLALRPRLAAIRICQRFQFGSKRVIS